MDAAEEQPRAPQFLLVLQDNLATGEVEVGGAQQPLEFDPRSPSHVIGLYIREHLQEIFLAAQTEASQASRDEVRARAAGLDQPDVGESILGPDRERTILIGGV